MIMTPEEKKKIRWIMANKRKFEFATRNFQKLVNNESQALESLKSTLMANYGTSNINAVGNVIIAMTALELGFDIATGVLLIDKLIFAPMPFTIGMIEGEEIGGQAGWDESVQWAQGWQTAPAEWDRLTSDMTLDQMKTWQELQEQLWQWWNKPENIPIPAPIADANYASEAKELARVLKEGAKLRGG